MKQVHRSYPKDRKNKYTLRADKLNEKAKDAYTTYAQYMVNHTPRGNYMPKWEDLSVEQKSAWRIVVMKMYNLK